MMWTRLPPALPCFQRSRSLTVHVNTTLYLPGVLTAAAADAPAALPAAPRRGMRVQASGLRNHPPAQCNRAPYAPLASSCEHSIAAESAPEPPRPQPSHGSWYSAVPCQ